MVDYSIDIDGILEQIEIALHNGHCELALCLLEDLRELLGEEDD